MVSVCVYRFSINSMLAHYLLANIGFKVAPHRFQIAGWWLLIFHPKACCLQSGPYKVALINHNGGIHFQNVSTSHNISKSLESLQLTVIRLSS